MTPTEANEMQNWHGMDGATAFQLIERHANDWSEIHQMMEAWHRANTLKIEKCQACGHEHTLASSLQSKQPPCEPD